MTEPRVHRVAVLVFNGVKVLDVSGPAEVFSEANLMGAHYQVDLLSPDGNPVTTSVGGWVLPVVGSVADAEHYDTVLVSGGDVLVRNPIGPELFTAAQELADRTERLASICTGAFILAGAGLLQGKRATTHWRHAEDLARAYPSIAVQPDAIFVQDGSVYTSAGVSAGIDLALALVEDDHGPELARQVARSLAVYMQRAGGQSQYSAALTGPSPRTSTLREVVQIIAADLTARHSVPELALAAHVSTRHLTRLFRDELDTTPARYIEGLRFDEARALLDAGYAPTTVAQRSGFESSETLRRVFVHRIGVPPSRYQARFSTTAPDSPD